jgi:hypothetical protein
MRTLQRLILRTARGPLRPMWSAVHRALMRLLGAYLRRGETGAALYVRGGFAVGDAIPGLSDADLAVVLAGEPGRHGRARRRVTRRWRRLRRVLPMLRKAVDLAVYEERELQAVAAAPTQTAARAVHFGMRKLPDQANVLMRPGLYGPLWDWRLLAGPGRRLDRRPWDAQERRLAAWLELQFWWRYVFAVCIDPGGPRAAYLCVKMISEPARIWLWLVHGERLGSRKEVLERAQRLMPEEDQALHKALALHGALGRSPPPQLADSLPVLVRLSSRLGRRLADEVEPHGATEVRLSWGGQDELVLLDGARGPLRRLAGEEPRLLPLADWRAVAWPLPPDEVFAPLPLDPARPADVAAAAALRSPPYPALLAPHLMVLPGTRGGLLRAVQCPVTDPVSFALAGGRDSAAFPNVAGWSAHDRARRAVAEHRAWLGLGDDQRPAIGELMWGQVRCLAPRLLTLARLFTAGRAALFLDSLEQGQPELLLTAAAVAKRLGAEEACERYRACRVERSDPPAPLVAAFRERVLALPAYRPAGWWTAAAPRRSAERMPA